MRKGILKSVLCTGLSLMMAAGGVFVGAAPKTTSVEKEIKAVNSVAAPKTKDEKVILSTTQKTQSKTANLLENATVPTIWNIKTKSVTKSVRIENGNYIGSIVIKDEGTLLANFGAEFYLRDAAGNYIAGSTNGIMYSANMKPGTYYLYSKENLNVEGKILLELYPNKNGRYLGSTAIMIGGTGKDRYQYFKMNKRGAAVFALEGVWLNASSFGKTYGISNYIQKKSGSSWKAISSTQYTTAKGNFACAYGLNSGTYRIVLKDSYKSGVIAAAYKQVVAADSYGTSKKKAKTISRKKTKKQTFLTTDSAKKEHWYKINVSKKRTTYIEVTGIGNSGGIYCTVSGKARFKTKNIKNGIRFYLNAPKGTYYINVHKYSKNSTGAYQVKYVK